jgi:uncharacterized phage protein gp47/JayE
MPMYGKKDQSQIVVEILEGLQKNAGISAVYPGSIARALAEAIGTEIAQLYSSLNFSISQSDLRTASGRNLDLIGDLYGVARKTISEASVNERQSFNIEFIINKPYSRDISIPKNTYVYTDVDNFNIRQYRFKLYGDVTITTGSTRAYGLVVPDFTDRSYTAPINSLNKHSYVSPPGVIVYCNNPKEVYSVINSESDDNYRRRIVSSIKSQSIGTVDSLRFAVLGVKGVRDVRIRESTYGIGSCDIIIVPESGSTIKSYPELIFESIKNVKPVGVRFNVRVAEKLVINVSATVTLVNGITENMASGIKNQASLFIRRYLNSLTIGDPVSISEIERQVYLSSDAIKKVQINTFDANGQDLQLRDFTPTNDKIYPVAGNVVIYSAIMGQSNY